MTTQRKVAILGSTGTIGKQCLNIIREHRDQFIVQSLSCGSSLDSLVDQIEEFQPPFVSVKGKQEAQHLEQKLRGHKPIIFFDNHGHARCISEGQPEVVIAGMAGTHGFQAVLQTVKEECPILGLANKESIVMGGQFLKRALKNSKTEIVPVDSEHSGLFQALGQAPRESVRRCTITASGGPFLKLPLEEFSNIEPSQALKHPNWSMGAKISIDSATMMNKGLEWIEALILFDLAEDQLNVLIQPESIIHALVEHVDGSVIAQMAISDMRIPISLALGYPKRLNMSQKFSLNLAQMGRLHFEEPDFNRFPCLKLAMQSMEHSPSGPIVLNAANEVAVASFLEKAIPFAKIPTIVEQALEVFSHQKVETLEDVIALDGEVKRSLQMKKRTLNEVAL